MNDNRERAAWLAGDLLLLSGSSFGNGDVSASSGDDAVEVSTQALGLPSNGSEDGERVLVISRFAASVADQADSLCLTLGTGKSARSLDATGLADWLVDPFFLLCQELAPLETAPRSDALRFLWSAVSSNLGRPGSFSLAQLLSRVQHELRPALPPMVFTRDHPAAAHVDTVVKLGQRAVWVRGWIHDRENTVVRLSLVAPEGGRADLTAGHFRFRRRDTEELFGEKDSAGAQRHGFVRFAELDGPSQLSTGWLLELETTFGGTVQRPVPDLVVNPIVARDTIFACLREERPGRDELMRDHVHPAIAMIQDAARGAAAIDTVVQLGDPPTSPSVSVIVPLYNRLSFLEDQMAQWASDPQMAHEDLIYVLDSPDQAPELEEQAHWLFSIYGIPFRIAVMRTNAGFAGANNCAVQLARAGKLLLLNSDVIPDAPGWLGHMSAFYDATPSIGALGPKLLYEDSSIQHAGMYFYRLVGSTPWENMHYFKGQHRHLPAANLARQVPAVTGACLMVDRQLYEKVGGLSYRYVMGGYEDSDFCLRLIDEGREQWYMPGAELFHLEDQSYPKDLRKRATRYNMWLHTELWGERIERLMTEYFGLNAS